MATEHVDDGEHVWPTWTGRLAVESAREELCAALLHSNPQMTAGQAKAQTAEAMEEAYSLAAISAQDEGGRLETTAKSISDQARVLAQVQ